MTAPLVSVIVVNRRLFEFVGFGEAAAGRQEAAVAEMKSPPSLGRWRPRSAAEVRSLTEGGEPALREFGTV